MIPALLILMITIVIHNMYRLYRYIMYAWMINGPKKLPPGDPARESSRKIFGHPAGLRLREYLNRKPSFFTSNHRGSCKCSLRAMLGDMWRYNMIYGYNMVYI